MSAPRLRAVPPAETEPPDGALVEASRRGDRRAMEDLFRRHARRLFGLAYRVIGRDDDIEDIVQEAFVFGIERLAKLDDGEAFASWMGTIVVRQALRRIRRRRLLSRLGILAEGQVDPDDVVSGLASPERALELRGIYAAFDAMSAEVRVALVLHRVEGITLEETAKTMGLSLATVKRRIKEGEAIVRGRVGARA